MGNPGLALARRLPLLARRVDSERFEVASIVRVRVDEAACWASAPRRQVRSAGANDMEHFNHPWREKCKLDDQQSTL